MEEFSEHTFNEASVNTIVKNSGISKGSLYQYFEDKLDIYLYILEIAGNKKLQYLEACSACFEADDFFEMLTEIMIRGCEFDLNNPRHSQLLHKALTGPLVDESMRHMVESNRRYVKQLLKTGIEKHQVREDIDVDMMVYFINSMIMNFAGYISTKAQVDYFGDLYHPKQLDNLKEMDLSTEIREMIKLMRSGLQPLHR